MGRARAADRRLRSCTLGGCRRAFTGFAEPDYVANLDDVARARCVTGKGDFRELVQDEHRHYFIRGVIEIPIVGEDQPFRYGVWATLNLKTSVHVRAKVRPAIELEPTDHPLAIEQRTGITLARVEEIIAKIMHPPA